MGLHMSGITKSYQGKIVLNHLNYEFADHGLYIIAGKSGSGKSTLLNLIAGFEETDEGMIQMEEGMTCSYVFQNFELIRELSVRENILLGQTIWTSLPDPESSMQTIIKALDIESLLHHYPDELSQGQKQRVGIARALLEDGDIYICDEPTEALDEDIIETVLSLFKEMAKDKLVLIATHNRSIIQDPSAHLLTLEAGEIISQQDRIPNISSCNSRNDRVYQKQNVQSYVWQIMQKKHKSQMILFFISMLLIFGFYLLYARIFTDRPHPQIANKEFIYINHESGITGFSDIEVTRILEFTEINLEGQLIDAKIVPLPGDIEEFPILGDSDLKGNDLLINQWGAELYKKMLKITNDQELLGQKVTLSLKEQTSIRPVEFVIKGIIEEADIDGTIQLYYNPTTLDEILKEIPVFTENLYYHAYRASNEYMVIPTADNRDEVFHRLLELKGYGLQNVYNAELTQWEVERAKTSTYYPYFITLLIVYLIIQFVFLLDHFIKEWNYHAGSMMVLLSCGAVARDVKQCYRRKKFIDLGSCFLVLFVLLGCCVLLCFNKVISFLLAYLLIYGLFVWTITIYITRKIKKSSIAIYLKNDKEYR